MTSTHSEPKFRVAICGGGIGGLTLACALSRAPDIAVDVYEAASQFSEIGAGVTILPRAMSVLSGLGLAEDIAAIDGNRHNKTASGPAPTMILRRADGPGMHKVSEFGGGGSVSVHRAEFHNILLKHISKDVGLHPNKRLASYTDEGKDTPVRLVFADGTEATCDVLVGADGIKSAVRAVMYNDLADKTQDKEKAEKLRDCVPPRYSGANSYRTIVSKDKLSGVSPDSSVWKRGLGYIGNGATIVTYPISQGAILNVVIVTYNHALEWTLYPGPFVAPADSSEFAHIFKDWAEEPRQLIKGLEDIETKKWVINVVQPLDTWTTGRVALLGDAAHAMTPFLGAGAAQAVEDAHTLSTLLMHPRATRDTIQEALRVYQEVRRPAALEIFNAARNNGLVMSDSSVPVEEVARVNEDGMRKAYGGSPVDDSQRAVEIFEAVVSGV